MNAPSARSFKALFCAIITLFTAGCVVYPDGTMALLPPPSLPVAIGAPVYAYGGYPGYYRPYYGYYNYAYRPYWGGGLGGYGYRGGYGGYYRGAYWGGGSYHGPYRGGGYYYRR